MKSLVVYSTKTGNTRKLAHAVLEVAPGDKTCSSISNAPDPDGYDLVCVGFWLQGGLPDQKTRQYLGRIKEGQRVFLFATHGAAPDSDHAAAAMDYAREELLPEAQVVGAFNCQGEVDPDFLEKIQTRPEPPEWIAAAPQAVGHPNKHDIRQLQESLQTAVARPTPASV